MRIAALQGENHAMRVEAARTFAQRREVAKVKKIVTQRVCTAKAGDGLDRAISEDISWG